jgi:hypothetical protein
LLFYIFTLKKNFFFLKFITSRQNAELSNLQFVIKNKDKQEEQQKQELADVRLQAEAAIKTNTETLKKLESLELIHR